MAMGKCRECKKDVSTNAKTCPHCGIGNPGISPSQSLVGGIVALVVLFFVLKACFGSCSDSTAHNSASTTTAAPEPVKCAANDLHCVGEKHSIAASVHCPDMIERMAKHTHEWTDGVLEPKFSHYRWADQTQGVVTYIGDKVKFQNGFGAWTNMTYECDLDANTEQVVDVRVREGHL